MTEIKVSELPEVTTLDDVDLFMGVHLADGPAGSKKITVANTRSLLITPLKGAANGIASLDAGGKIPSTQLPAITITDTFVVASQAAMLALTAERGDVAVRSDTSVTYILTAEPASTLANWQLMLSPTSPVQSVNGQTGAVIIDAASLGAALDSAVVHKTGDESIDGNKTLVQRLKITADAGTNQRLASIAADGTYTPIAEATWAGGVLTLNGKLVLPPSVAGSAYLNLGDGVAPTSPANGDVWLSGSWVRYRSGGTTFSLVPTAISVATQWSLTGGGSLGVNRTLNLVNDLAVPPTDADYGTDSMRRRGWYKGNESLPTPAPFSPSRSSFGTFPTGPIAVPALNPAAAFAAFAHGA